jgi:Raf kinase inhibitor-like YbhB/YbcL family protein
VICDDPDAPTNEPWVHWLIWNIPPKRHGLPEGLPRHDELTGTVTARQGANSFASDNVGYRGPAPPPGHGTHHYHFKVYALDTTLDLPAGSDRDRLMAAMEGHVLADGELVATYER